MQSIEQRAEQYANRKTGYSRDFRWREAFKDYAQGAEAQKAIDDEQYRQDLTYVVAKKQEWIDQASDWLTQRLSFGIHPCNGTSVVSEFRQAMQQ